MVVGGSGAGIAVEEVLVDERDGEEKGGSRLWREPVSGCARSADTGRREQRTELGDGGGGKGK